MKKLLCFTVSIILLVSTLCSIVQAVIFTEDDTSDLHYSFYNTGRHILSDYNSGKFGDEAYYLASFGGWGGRGDVAVFIKDSLATIVLYQSWGRYKERALSDVEYNEFLSFVQNNKIDELPDWDTYMVSDGIEYEYLHFTKDKKAAVYMNNPGTVEGKDDEIYSSLVSLFWDLTQTENLEVRYDIDNVEILIKNEDHKVQSVWKDGDDFRVLIKDEENSTYDYEKLDWYKFGDGKVGEKTDEPDGVFLQNAWNDDPGTHMVDLGDNSGTLGGFSMQQHGNNYPWQVTWNDYRVRAMDCYDEGNRGDGLWLTKVGEEPILIKKGIYANPVVIPNTDWVICSRSDEGWANPGVVVKINLRTFEETVIDIPPSNRISPSVYVNGKVLISRADFNASFKAEQYLYNPASDTVERADGDFNPLFDLKGRYLQKSSVEGKYFALGDQFTVGIYDVNNYTFTETSQYSTLIYDNDHMWVDEEKGRIYIVVNQDLISLPFSGTPIYYEHDIKVKINEKSILFDQPPTIQDGRTLVPMRAIFEGLGANVSWSEEEQLIVAFKGQKIILIKIGEKSFTVIDASGYEIFEDFVEAIYEESMMITDTPSFDVGSISEKFEFDVLPQIIGGRTLIPVRAISEALGVKVDWDDENSTVLLSCDKAFLNESNKGSDFINILFFYEVFFK